MAANDAVPQKSSLSVDDCWHLLRAGSYGRLAVWVIDHPEIFPINYRIDRGLLVFRTGHGTKLASALGKVVAFETDGTENNRSIAWSVVVKGHANRLDRTPEILDSVGRLLVPWDAGTKDHFIGITPESLSGRRFTIAEPFSWGGQLDDATRAGLE
ncbi:hypothetical protein IWX64_002555 [Arthrobacter sp. CAN_A212]|uniref:pyridoxamine 5'-phosphate oxidase family protein n=1 Tax=Arthrobacter sp. CAN_A212 TaxID=2787719 RepID=UPI0018C91E37